MSKLSPLAYRVRPVTLQEYVGQKHLLGTGKPLTTILSSGAIFSMLLYGPPGTGKTTLAHIIANESNSHIEALSAVTSGVKDIRKVVDIAEKKLEVEQKNTILFLDEIHRYNKAQQDVLLPYLESGLLTLIGATTENPFFSMNNALLSRVTVFRLESLLKEDIEILLLNTCEKDEVLKEADIIIESKALESIYHLSGGDCRIALNLLESAFYSTERCDSKITITKTSISNIAGNNAHKIDKGSDFFYDQLSAFHKSIRGSSPDAAVFWMANMIESGCDPFVLARRMLCIASEDIGNADPRALSVALDAWQALERLGLPEGTLPLSQAATYLASAPKSNAAYLSYKKARQDLKNHTQVEVPLHLRNIVPPGISRKESYKYPHDYDHAFVVQQYLPDGVSGEYYQPNSRGLETKIKQKLDSLASVCLNTSKQK